MEPIRIEALMQLLEKEKRLKSEIRKIESVLQHTRGGLRMSISVNDIQESPICTINAMPPAVYDGFSQTLDLLRVDLRDIQKEIDEF